MKLPCSGCCCGIIVGFFFSILLAAVGTIAVFCWFNPEARKSGISVIEKTWNTIKEKGDEVINKIPEVKVPEVKIPEVKVPEVKIPEISAPEIKIK